MNDNSLMIIVTWLGSVLFHPVSSFLPMRGSRTSSSLHSSPHERSQNLTAQLDCLMFDSQDGSFRAGSGVVTRVDDPLGPGTEG